MGNEHRNGITWISISEEIRGLPRSVQVGIGMLLSTMCSYYLVRLVLIVLGEPTAVLFDFVGLLLRVGFLFVIGVIGFACRRIIIVHFVFACVAGAYIGYHLLLVSGDLLVSVRQVIFYTAMPVISGLLLAKWVKRLDLLDR